MSGAAELDRLDRLAERFEHVADAAAAKVTRWRHLIRSVGWSAIAASFHEAADMVRMTREAVRQDMTQCHCVQCETRRSDS